MGHVQAGAPTLGVTLFHAESQPPDLTPAFAAVTRERADAIFAAHTPSNYTYRRTIAEFAAKNRLPTSCDEARGCSPRPTWDK